jgi:hypothetical protein
MCPSALQLSKLVADSAYSGAFYTCPAEHNLTPTRYQSRPIEQLRIPHRAVVDWTKTESPTAVLSPNFIPHPLLPSFTEIRTKGKLLLSVILSVDFPAAVRSFRDARPSPLKNQITIPVPQLQQVLPQP